MEVIGRLDVAAKSRALSDQEHGLRKLLKKKTIGPLFAGEDASETAIPFVSSEGRGCEHCILPKASTP